MKFHARCISMHMYLNGTKRMYTISTGLHMMIYMVSCLDVYDTYILRSCEVHVFMYS